ncbi:hypothetical protein [Persicobacter diffluens]
MGSAGDQKASQPYFHNIIFSSPHYSNKALMDSVSRFHGPPTLITALIFLFRFLSRKNEKVFYGAGLVVRIFNHELPEFTRMVFEGGWGEAVGCFFHSNKPALINGRKALGSAGDQKSSQPYFHNIIFSSPHYSNKALMDSVSRFHGPPELITALIFLFRFLSRKNERVFMGLDLY